LFLNKFINKTFHFFALSALRTIIIIVFLFSTHLYAQNKEDTSAVSSLIAKARKTYRENPQAALKDLNSAITIAEKIKFKKGLIVGQTTKGSLLRHLGEYDSAIVLYNKTIKICDTIKDWYYLSTLFNNLGNVYLKKVIEHLHSTTSRNH